MIRKMRIKLVTAAMLSLLIVLGTIIGAVSVLNYRKIVVDANQKLQLLAENGGIFPNDMEKHGHRFSAEMPFESRYFSVELDENLTITSVNTGKIASVDSDQAESYAQMVLTSGEECGFVDSYRYLIYTDVDGVTHICFLSCYRELEAFRDFVLSSILVSIIGVSAVLLLLIVTSQRIIKPVSDSYEKQKRFITDAGHELKTPLTIISADTEVLEMDYGENEWLSDIRSQTERLADLTNSLVFLARMEEQPQMEKLDFSLSEAAKEAADDFSAVAKMKGKELKAVIEPDIILRGEEKTIRRLMAIFLDNAVKYSGENGRIEMSLDKWRGQIRLQVSNTTDGIDKEEIPHLFDRFYRTDKSRNSQTGGFGLGLSIASAIAASHNGKISASAKDDQQLLITVLFPGTNK